MRAPSPRPHGRDQPKPLFHDAVARVPCGARHRIDQILHLVLGSVGPVHEADRTPAVGLFVARRPAGCVGGRIGGRIARRGSRIRAVQHPICPASPSKTRPPLESRGRTRCRVDRIALTHERPRRQQRRGFSRSGLRASRRAWPSRPPPDPTETPRSRWSARTGCTAPRSGRTG